MEKPYRECSHCGAHLDAGEWCNCGKSEQQGPTSEERPRMRLIAVCREVDKDTGRTTVYPLDIQLDGQILKCLQIRAQMNPELRYFILFSARWERCGAAITSILKRRTVTAADVERIGEIVEL